MNNRKNKIANLVEYKVEEITFHSGTVRFEKHGNLGIITAINIYHTENVTQNVVKLAFPEWFIPMFPEKEYLGAMTSDWNFAGEISAFNKEIAISSTLRRDISISGQVVLPVS